MDDIEFIVREIGRQQGKNAYYRICYNLFKQLQEIVAHSSEKLILLNYEKTPLSPEKRHAVCHIVEHLRLSVKKLIDHKHRAHSDLEDLFFAEEYHEGIDVPAWLWRLDTLEHVGTDRSRADAYNRS